MAPHLGAGASARRSGQGGGLEGDQSPWMDRACEVGNGRARYGLVDGATPWSRLLGVTRGLSRGLETGRENQALRTHLAPEARSSPSGPGPVRRWLTRPAPTGLDLSGPSTLAVRPRSRAGHTGFRPASVRKRGEAPQRCERLGGRVWCCGDVELSGLGRSGASPSRSVGCPAQARLPGQPTVVSRTPEHATTCSLDALLERPRGSRRFERHPDPTPRPRLGAGPPSWRRHQREWVFLERSSWPSARWRFSHGSPALRRGRRAAAPSGVVRGGR
jgi:hypothetical protein